MSEPKDSYLKPRVIDEVAMPAGLFPGTSKITFDVLHEAWSRAARAGDLLQLTRRQLLEMTHIRSENTLSAHLKYFRSMALVTVTPGAPGDHRGCYYAVHVDRIEQAVKSIAGRRPKLGRASAPTATRAAGATRPAAPPVTT